MDTADGEQDVVGNGVHDEEGGGGGGGGRRERDSNEKREEINFRLSHAT